MSYKTTPEEKTIMKIKICGILSWIGVCVYFVYSSHKCGTQTILGLALLFLVLALGSYSLGTIPNYR